MPLGKRRCRLPPGDTLRMIGRLLWPDRQERLVSRFLFSVCQVGAESAVKKEICLFGLTARGMARKTSR